MNDFITLDMESYKEKIFKQRCIGFLSCICAEQLIETTGLLNKLLNSDVLSNDDINHILLRKYCISTVAPTEITTQLDSYIRSLSMFYVNDLITKNIDFKKIILKVYLENIDIPNSYLAVQKNNQLSSGNIIKTLDCIDKFYESRQQSQQNIPAYIKSYK